jgi:predicted nucleic acid-binding protein
MIFVDSGFLVALAERRDSLHQRALAWAQHVHEPLLVSEYVFCETINALSAPVDRPKGHAIIRDFQSNPTHEIIPASRELFQAGLALHAARRDKAWSLTDCISFYTR